MGRSWGLAFCLSTSPWVLVGGLSWGTQEQESSARYLATLSKVPAVLGAHSVEMQMKAA